MFSCRRCGQEWEKDPRLAVACVRCGAAAGVGCKRPSGHSGPFVEPHVIREQAALDSGLITLCPCAIEQQEWDRAHANPPSAQLGLFG